MSAELVMAGPGQLVVHDVSHDLESLFYVLVGICVLLDEPFKFKSNDDLSRCFDKYFNTFEPSVLKSVIIQSDLTWFPMIIDHISTYFKPLLPLLTRLRQDIVSPMYTSEDGRFCRAKPLTHHILIDAIIDTLLNLDNGAWTPYHNPDAGKKHCVGRYTVDEESKHRGCQDEMMGGDEDEDKDREEDENELEMLPLADDFSATPPTPSIISNSTSDHVESLSETPTHLLRWHNLFQPITRPPDLPNGFTSRASGGMGFQSDTFMEVQGQALRNTLDDYSHPRAKRARSSSKPTDEVEGSSSRSLPRSVRRGQSTNTGMLRRSARITSKKPEYL